MTVSRRLRIPAILLPVLLLALAMIATSSPTAMAAEPGTPEFCSDAGEHPSCANLPNDDGCYGCESGPCEYNSAIFASNPACVAPTPPCQYNSAILATDPACVAPTPEPAPAPAPTDACPDVEGLQTDASLCAPESADSPEPDFEADSLTIQTVQHDPAATIGPEETILAATEASGGGTSAIVTPTGALPYTGMTVTQVAILGVAMLWLGSIAWFVAAVVRRRRAAEAAA